MGKWSKQNEVSTLLVDESFTAQDDQFVDRVRGVTNSKYLAGLADRWKKDPRPWAREQIFKYLALPLDRPGHPPLVKRLFKQAEENRDTALMAEIAVAFDRLIRRQRRTRWHYDWRMATDWESWSRRQRSQPCGRSRSLPPFSLIWSARRNAGWCASGPFNC